jgi:hypothetical protein
MGAVTLMIGRAREGDRGALQLDQHDCCYRTWCTADDWP